MRHITDTLKYDSIVMTNGDARIVQYLGGWQVHVVGLRKGRLRWLCDGAYKHLDQAISRFHDESLYTETISTEKG